jgi:hypothetical protein
MNSIKRNPLTNYLYLQKIQNMKTMKNNNLFLLVFVLTATLLSSSVYAPGH